MFHFSDDSMRIAFKSADNAYCPHLMVSVKNEYSYDNEFSVDINQNSKPYSCPITLFCENNAAPTEPIIPLSVKNTFSPTTPPEISEPVKICRRHVHTLR